MSRRVVITGTGILSPIGNSTHEFYIGLKKSANGIAPITCFNTDDYSVHIAGEVKINLEDYFEKRELNRMDRFTAMALIASSEAVNQSNIDDDRLDKNRIGVVIGSGIGGINTFEEQHKKLLNNPRWVSPFFIPSMISDIASGQVSIKYGFKGPNYCVVSACATASHAIGDSFRMIQYGDADIIITGGSDASITPMAVSGFANMKALTKNDDPETASRPFDANRDGFVMGEGTGIIILEELKHAQKRGAEILGEIAGYGATADAHHLTSPAPDGDGAVRAMNRAMEDANCKPVDIDYINAHGTSTPVGDLNETNAIKETFKDSAYKLVVNSTKSMTGHLLGAAGAVEAGISVCVLRKGVVPPTINYHSPDPDCDLDYVPNIARALPIRTVLSNSFGFGGHNSSLLFRQWND